MPASLAISLIRLKMRRHHNSLVLYQLYFIPQFFVLFSFDYDMLKLYWYGLAKRLHHYFLAPILPVFFEHRENQFNVGVCPCRDFSDRTRFGTWLQPPALLYFKKLVQKTV